MGNSQVENFITPLLKTVTTAVAAEQNYENELQKFLINFRNSPVPNRALGLSPNEVEVEVIFKRKLKTKLPQLSVHPNDKYLRERDRRNKLKNKQYADQKRRAKPCTLKYGDNVLVKRPSHTKEETAFYPTPAKVIRRKGAIITIKFRDKYVTQDASKLKYIRYPGNTTIEQQRHQQNVETTSNQSAHRDSIRPQQPTELCRSRREMRPPIHGLNNLFDMIVCAVYSCLD